MRVIIAIYGKDTAATISKKAQNDRLKELIKLLTTTHEIVCDRYRTVLLFTPKSHEMERDKDGVYNYTVKVFKGAFMRPILEKDVQSSSEMKGGSLYLAPFKSDESILRPISLLPFTVKRVQGRR
jgi:cytoplasmic iron level regulating protein YaaA (DUF328/UPF0246 family)